MRKYEVVLVYRGQANYIVEANNPSQAEAMARAKFYDGESPDTLGNEWEEVEKVASVEPLEAQEPSS